MQWKFGCDINKLVLCKLHLAILVPINFGHFCYLTNGGNFSVSESYLFSYLLSGKLKNFCQLLVSYSLGHNFSFNFSASCFFSYMLSYKLKNFIIKKTPLGHDFFIKLKKIPNITGNFQHFNLKLKTIIECRFQLPV